MLSVGIWTSHLAASGECQHFSMPLLDLLNLQIKLWCFLSSFTWLMNMCYIYPDDLSFYFCVIFVYLWKSCSRLLLLQHLCPLWIRFTTLQQQGSHLPILRVWHTQVISFAVCNFLNKPLHFTKISRNQEHFQWLTFWSLFGYGSWIPCWLCNSSSSIQSQYLCRRKPSLPQR